MNSTNKLNRAETLNQNGALRAVSVNGVEAKLSLVQTGLADWEALIDLPASGQLNARGVDQAGNTEAPGHRPAIGI